jgi:hypothetical protein
MNKIRQVTKYEVCGFLFNSQKDAEDYIKFEELKDAMRKYDIRWDCDNDIKRFFAANEKLIKEFYE